MLSVEGGNRVGGTDVKGEGFTDFRPKKGKNPGPLAKKRGKREERRTIKERRAPEARHLKRREKGKGKKRGALLRTGSKKKIKRMKEKSKKYGASTGK